MGTFFLKSSIEFIDLKLYLIPYSQVAFDLIMSSKVKVLIFKVFFV